MDRIKKNKTCSHCYASSQELRRRVLRAKFCKRGFSLIEMLVSMFIMVTIVTTVTAVFAKSYLARKNARQYQTNLEEARTAIEAIAKNMRMSSKTRDITPTKVEMYNNSQGICIRYEFTGSALTQSTAMESDPADCAASLSYSAPQNMIASSVTGGFNIERTDTTVGSKKVGKGTIWIKMGNQTLQTTVSFRDYREVIQ